MIRLALLCLVVTLSGCMEGEKSKPEQRNGDKANDNGKIEAAKAQLAELTKAVETYMVKFGAWPQSLNELVTPREGAPFVKQGLLTDPWGSAYLYDPSGPHHMGNKPDLWTVGPDKQPIGNWPEKK